MVCVMAGKQPRTREFCDCGRRRGRGRPCRRCAAPDADTRAMRAELDEPARQQHYDIDHAALRYMRGEPKRLEIPSC